MSLSMYPGDEVYVDDGMDIVAHLRSANLRQVYIFVEDTGDFALPRDAVKSADNGKVVLFCKKLPIKMRAAIGHLHGEQYDEEA